MVGSTDAQPATPFGTVVAPHMVVATTVDGVFGALEVQPTAPLPMHPFAHVFHYGSACFEGLKAHRGADGRVRIFRPDRHATRLADSASRLLLPVPDVATILSAMTAVVRANLDVVPDPPGSLYLRPLLVGVDPNIGAAAAPSREAMLVVLASPVGDYFAAGGRPLKVAVETVLPRTTPQFGRVKAGANYAMALGVTDAARTRRGADQVVFAPGGVVQETGAANVLLLAPDHVRTPALDDGFLHGVTRDSVLTIARDRGMTVTEDRLTVDEVVAWLDDGGELALAGTAAVLAAVGTVVVGDRVVTSPTTRAGFHPVTSALRNALIDVQQARAPDRHHWLVDVSP